MNASIEDDLSHALQAVLDGQSIRRAALDWGIPRTTLQNWLYGHEPRRQVYASAQRLSPEQEKHLSSWVLTQEALGTSPIHTQIKQFAQRMLATKGDL
jgi:hypothetical protein